MFWGLSLLFDIALVIGGILSTLGYIFWMIFILIYDKVRND